MKYITKFKIFLLSLTSLGLGFILGDGLTQIHPGYSLTNIQPPGNEFRVGGMDLFSDGRLAICNWGNPGEVWIVSGAETGTASTVKASLYAFGMQQVMGCHVVQDTLYVFQTGELTQLVDVNGDGKADQYNNINDAFATSENLLGLNFDFIPFGGSFYATLPADIGFGGNDLSPALPDRSSFVRMGRDNTIEYLASGFRNTYGMGMGFGNKMFVSDNQGTWCPADKLIYLEKGKFYGHRTTPANRFQSQPESPPLLWLPYPEVSQSPGGPLFISEGIFKNQFLFGEEHRGIGGGRIYRISVQDVGGTLQGALMPFSGAIGTGVSRLAQGKNNIIYTGLLGGDCCWSTVSTTTPGLKRLTPKDVTKSHAFEMLAVRSGGASTLEIEFTSPPAADATNPARYAVETWNHIPGAGYGVGNKQNQHPLSVQSATLKADGKTVVLTIGGLLEKYLVHINLVGLKGADGSTPWGSEAWFTLNKYGPGVEPVIGGCMDNKNPAFNPNATVSDPAACIPVVTRAQWTQRSGFPLQKLGKWRIRLDLPENQSYALEMFDLRGIRQASWQGKGAGEIDLANQEISSGLYEMRLKAGSRNWSQLWLEER